jgi:archaemetzincin
MMRFALALAAALVVPIATAHADAKVVYLQPLGDELPDADVEAVKQAITLFYAVPVTVLPRTALPKEAWYPPRRRWRAEKLTEFLATRRAPDALRILGLTAADISTTKGKIVDWGVLGLGDLDGPAGVISTFRCHKGARSELHARQRLMKVAVHEIGHTLGLPHCPTAGCLMEDALGKVATVDGELDLCDRCRAQLRESGHTVPSVAPPWPKP